MSIRLAPNQRRGLNRLRDIEILMHIQKMIVHTRVTRHTLVEVYRVLPAKRQDYTVVAVGRHEYCSAHRRPVGICEWCCLAPAADRGWVRCGGDGASIGLCSVGKGTACTV